jgi:hypothetical protein
MTPYSKNGFRISALLVLCVLAFSFASRAAQTPQKTPVGALQTTGQVTVNGAVVHGTQSVFPGDSIQTGPDGAASLGIPDIGTFTVAANTTVIFPASNFLATLKVGTVGMHASQGAKNIEVQFGNFLVFVPDYESEATATITVAADGSARAECHGGSVGITQIEGAASVFLKDGQTVTVSAAGELGAVEGAGAAASTPTASTTAASSTPAAAPPTKKSHATLILIAVGGGAAAAAGAALAARHSSSTSSPSSPGGF